MFHQRRLVRVGRRAANVSIVAVPWRGRIVLREIAAIRTRETSGTNQRAADFTTSVLGTVPLPNVDAVKRTGGSDRLQLLRNRRKENAWVPPTGCVMGIVKPLDK
jgi:hypothetical protein